jgi:ribosomal protein L1
MVTMLHSIMTVSKAVQTMITGMKFPHHRKKTMKVAQMAMADSCSSDAEAEDSNENSSNEDYNDENSTEKDIHHVIVAP